jgi:exosortase
MTPVKQPESEVQSVSIPTGTERLASRSLLFALFAAISAVIFWAPLKQTWRLSLRDDTYSYLPLIPLIILGLLYYERKKIFGAVRYSLGGGLPLVVVGALLGGASLGLRASLSPDWKLFLAMLSLTVLLIGAFVVLYGVPAARAGSFELLTLLLMVPLPHFLIDGPIILVQHGSADVTAMLYQIFGVPVFRQGMIFSLPGLTYEVAYECSGIHSTLALLIGSLLASHFYLRRMWKKVFLVLVVLPIVCFTNGLRMFGLSILAIYVDRSFFFGNLHHRGGVFFFALGLIMLGLIVKWLRRRDASSGSAAPVPQPG